MIETIIFYGVILLIIYFVNSNKRREENKKREEEERKNEKRRNLGINSYKQNEKQYPIVLCPYVTKNTSLILPSQKTYSDVGQGKQGASDIFFANELKKYFPNVSTNFKLGVFYPDIVIYKEDNFYIDVEIDEVYTMKGKDIIHSIGDDNHRNRFFQKKGWYVLRFSEEQIRTETKSCCKFAAQIYAYYTFDKDPLNKLINIKDLSFTEQWTREMGYQYRQENVRNKWLKS